MSDSKSRKAFRRQVFLTRDDLLAARWWHEGMQLASHPTRHAASLYASRDDGAAFMSGEVAISAGRVRAVARAVAGARREWSAVAIAGARAARPVGGGRVHGGRFVAYAPRRGRERSSPARLLRRHVARSR